MNTWIFRKPVILAMAAAVFCFAHAEDAKSLYWVDAEIAEAPIEKFLEPSFGSSVVLAITTLAPQYEFELDGGFARKQSMKLPLNYVVGLSGSVTHVPTSAIDKTDTKPLPSSSLFAFGVFDNFNEFSYNKVDGLISRAVHAEWKSLQSIVNLVRESGVLITVLAPQPLDEIYTSAGKTIDREMIGMDFSREAKIAAMEGFGLEAFPRARGRWDESSGYGGGSSNLGSLGLDSSLSIGN